MLNLFETYIKKGEKSAPSRLREIKRIVEALLFSSSDPIDLDKMREIVETAYPIKRQELKVILEELQDEYVALQRAFRIEEGSEGYRLTTVKEMAPFIEILVQNKRGEKLSRAALEVLAIVAYKQPITRAEVDKIRGVDSSGTVTALLERELIEVVGKLEAPGHPRQYGTTKRFLRHFGLKSAEELIVSNN